MEPDNVVNVSPALGYLASHVTEIEVRYMVRWKPAFSLDLSTRFI